MKFYERNNVDVVDGRCSSWALAIKISEICIVERWHMNGAINLRHCWICISAMALALLGARSHVLILSTGSLATWNFNKARKYKLSLHAMAIIITFSTSSMPVLEMLWIVWNKKSARTNTRVNRCMPSDPNPNACDCFCARCDISLSQAVRTKPLADNELNCDNYDCWRCGGECSRKNITESKYQRGICAIKGCILLEDNVLHLVRLLFPLTVCERGATHSRVECVMT